MTGCFQQDGGPLVSVLIPTFNRRRYLAEALSSVVRQSYRNLEIFVINDGGEDVSDIVGSFGDRRINFINRKENRGKAHSLNEALTRAKGKYISYLDDDDLYYPHHVQTLVDVLENEAVKMESGEDSCQVAYSDLYKAHCRILPDGRRQVLSKNVEVSRDFDRFFLLFYNHVLHVSLMHRKDLLAKTGLYEENIKVLIDWDMTRRLAFFSDFKHVYEVTGQFHGPASECDRISVRLRKDKLEYLRNVLAIRTTRPAKPWPKMKDMGIILLTDGLNQQVKETLLAIWRLTFFPYTLYLPLAEGQSDKLRTDMPNVVIVSVAEPAVAGRTERIAAVLRQCEAEFVTIVEAGFAVSEMWVENAVYVLMNSSTAREGIEVEGSTDGCWAAVFRKGELERALANSRPPLSAVADSKGGSVRQSLASAGISIRRPCSEEFPFQFDALLTDARVAQVDGNWSGAGQIYEYIGRHYGNRLWMKANAANAYYYAGAVSKAAQLSAEVNQQRPTVSTLLIEAKAHRKKNNFYSATGLLEKAREILEGSESIWT